MVMSTLQSNVARRWHTNTVAETQKIAHHPAFWACLGSCRPKVNLFIPSFFFPFLLHRDLLETGGPQGKLDL